MLSGYLSRNTTSSQDRQGTRQLGAHDEQYHGCPTTIFASFFTGHNTLARAWIRWEIPSNQAQKCSAGRPNRKRIFSNAAARRQMPVATSLGAGTLHNCNNISHVLVHFTLPAPLAELSALSVTLSCPSRLKTRGNSTSSGPVKERKT